MSPETVDVDSPDLTLALDGGVATITLHRGKVNALSEALQDAIGRAAAVCAERDDVAAVVITGSERAFAAGVDIDELAAMSQGDMMKRGPVMHAAFGLLARLPKPVVAAVAGFALGGGCELALCADVRFAAETAVFGQPEVKLGVIPGAGGTQRLPRLIGPARAKDMIFTGRMVKADEALAMGLVDAVFPAEELLPRATEWARQFVGGPALALRAAKECVDAGLETDIDSGLALERAQFASMFATADKASGMASFQQHGPGKATFEGR